MKNKSIRKASIHRRLKAIIESETEETGRFTWLQKRTEISRNTWQTWWDKEDAPPSGKMIEAAARLWPKYAFWLACGLTDEQYGHTYPKAMDRAEAWPEFEEIEKKRANDYFSHCVKMQGKEFQIPSTYRTEQQWNEDWEILGALSWMREVERESFQKIPCEERIKAEARTSPATRPWWPDGSLGEES